MSTQNEICLNWEKLLEVIIEKDIKNFPGVYGIMNVIIFFVFGDSTFFLTFIDYWIRILQIHFSNNLKVHFT